MTTMMAPIVPHMAEDVWQNLPYKNIILDMNSNAVSSSGSSSNKAVAAGKTLIETTPSVFYKGWIKRNNNNINSQQQSLPTLQQQQQEQIGERYPVHEEITWNLIRTLRNDVNRCIEMARQGKLVGATQECQVVLHIPTTTATTATGGSGSASTSSSGETIAATGGLEAFHTLLSQIKGDENKLTSTSDTTNMIDDLRFILLTSQITIVNSVDEVMKACPEYYLLANDTTSGVSIGVNKAKGKKCQRCWYYSDSVGEEYKEREKGHIHNEGDDICPRCAEVLEKDNLIDLIVISSTVSSE